MLRDFFKNIRFYTRNFTLKRKYLYMISLLVATAIGPSYWIFHSNTFPLSSEEGRIEGEKHNSWKPSSCRVSLTFDDGPTIRWTPHILKILRDFDAPATFFMTGEEVNNIEKITYQGTERAQRAQDMINEIKTRHTIGNHTWDHPYLVKNRLTWETIVTKQINPTTEIIQRVFGQIPKYFRPPYGVLSPQIKDLILQTTHMHTVFWDIDTRDWEEKKMNAPSIIDKVSRHFTRDPGLTRDPHHDAIVLMHDGHNGKNRIETIKALPTIIDVIRKNHCEIVPLKNVSIETIFP
ncbi:polysaccharide deacetylase family protein [Pasteuria penetrans]|uniref:polysaccharide deacetylase family protein n=1 Tax=Pasteuria penetrans TaxID=86005 RepID=UPI000FBDAC1C|nr:polysaccharide deacetylase family protein [Pasteuria penetrans]